MAITINWATRVITVPQADLTPLGGGIYELNIDTFRLALKGLEDDPDGMPFPRTHNHNTQVTVAGVTLARVIEIINGYTITFENLQYAVNLVAANSNIADVTNVNQVSIRSQNSAGLQIVTQGSGLSVEQSEQLQKVYRAHFHKRDVAANVIRIYDETGTTVLHEFTTDATFTHVTPA